ncbi:RNA chaperone Hfq [Paenibacillus sp. Leaf72]|uniref:RNA chaperone Hfq n=1 Tax=Paenibacillus sp. Leaf72 TaxID=1736234 RepID=UPI0006F1DF2D|nr:RNA chaperone Hfq [Paenibacillus sp. Leaf72]KQN98904.1 hypothetical protein ASF12_19110 [Paenibacillus sp. Leaf72]
MNKASVHTECSQDWHLDHFVKNELECMIITKNGVHLKGEIQLFDNYVVLIRAYNGVQSVVYKHAKNPDRSMFLILSGHIVSYNIF